MERRYIATLGFCPTTLLEYLFLQVKAIIESASQAPFGRGEATIVDTSVRNTWQLSPSQFTINSRKWSQMLQALLDKITGDLGCDAGKVTCELYKLLLYEPGGFFKVSISTVRT